jgi:hypothetical protein
MSDWWIVGIAYAVAAVFGVAVWWYSRSLRRSPSKELYDDAARGLEEGFAQLGMVRGAECPVCRKTMEADHRYEIRDDVRVCWTP